MSRRNQHHRRPEPAPRGQRQRFARSARGGRASFAAERVKRGSPEVGPSVILADRDVATPVSLSTCEANTVVMSCVRTVAETIGSLSAHVYQRLGDGSRRIASEHPYYWLLHAEPNHEMCAMSFWESAVAHLLLRGNAYAEVTWNTPQSAAAFWPIDPREVFPVRGSDGAIWYALPNNPGEKALPARTILHIPGFGFDGLVGYDPIAIIRRSVGLAVAAEQFGAKFFKNNAQMGAILKAIDPAQKLTPEKRQQLEASLAKHTGSANAFRWIILPNGVDYASVGVSPENGQYLDTRKFQRAEIAGWFRVPLYKINDLDKATLNNVEEMARGWVGDCLRPICEKIEQSVNRRLFRRSNYFFEFDLESLLRGNSKDRAAWYQTMFGMGVYSTNEIRRKENESSIGKAGDGRYISTGYMPIAQAKNSDDGATA